MSDGKCTLTGPMMTGLTVHLGPSACLEIDGIRIAVVSGKKQLLDRQLLRMVGIHAEAMRIVHNRKTQLSPYTVKGKLDDLYTDRRVIALISNGHSPMLFRSSSRSSRSSMRLGSGRFALVAGGSVRPQH